MSKDITDITSSNTTNTTIDESQQFNTKLPSEVNIPSQKQEECSSSEDSSEFKKETDSEEGEEFCLDEKSEVYKFVEVGNWGSFGVDEKFWCDKFKPVVKVTEYKDLILTEEEEAGFLTDRIVASCSSYLIKCPYFAKYVLAKVVLRNKGLKVIETLKLYFYLQYVDLSWNKLEDITALGNLPLLMYLDVSHNTLEDLLNFQAPFNLTYVNFSYNLIRVIPDLSAFWTIKYLNISHNKIEVIKGLQNLKYMETLDLSYNEIKHIENLEGLNVINLYLHHNDISSFTSDDNKGFKAMPYLTYVRIGYNNLPSLKIFQEAIFLQSIDAEENNISNLVELSYLEHLTFLISVNFNKNPIKNFDNYQDICFQFILNLKFLDGQPVNKNRKALSQLSSSYKIIKNAAQDHGNILTLSHLTKFSHLGLNVLPADQPSAPLVVVVGPIASKKESLIRYFAEQHPHRVIRLTQHTDREKYKNESSDSYHFVTDKDFNELLKKGEFLILYSVLDDNYGLSQDEFAKGVSQTGKVMIMHSDLTAALTLRLRGFCPVLILAMPKSEQIHKQWLMETYGTRVFNMRYPEAGVKILNRDNTESITTSETNLTDISEHKQTLDKDKLFFDYVKQYNMNPKISNTIVESESDDNYNDQPCQSELKTYNSLNSLEDYNTIYKMKVNKIMNEIDKVEEAESFTSYEFTFSEDESIYESLIQNFYSEILKLRDQYITFHQENSGFFTDIAFTDDKQNTMNIFKSAVKKAMENQKYKIESKFKYEYVCKSILKNRLDSYKRDIETAMNRNVNCSSQNISL